MKRFFALAALVLGLASCQTEPEGLDVQMGGAVDATITVNIPDSETRAGGTNSAGSAFHNGIIDDADYTVRYILQVFNEDGSASKDMMYKYSDDDTVAFDVHLVPGRNYRFVVWADIVNADGVQDGVKCADLHYVIGETLQNITLAVPVDGNDKWAAMDETRDAYTGIYDSVKFSASENITLTLKRPFAKLRVITTDMNELFGGVSPHNAEVKYTTPHYNAFNAFSGEASGERTSETHTYVIADYADQTGANKVLFTDYFFANESGVVKFTMDVKEANGQSIKYNTFNTDIAVKRNYLTTISGNILTDGNKVNVTIEDAFENVDNNGNTTNPNYDYKTISGDDEFLTAVNTPGKYVVISNLHIANEGDTVTTLATRAGGATTTIDLNGKTITVDNKGTGALASVTAGNTLVITNSVDGGKIELTEGSKGAFIENNGTVVIENGNIKSESTNNAPVINNNGTTNITGGELEAGAITNNGTTEVAGGVINEDAIVNTSEGTTNVTGGEFTYDPSNDVPEGFEINEENGKFVVTECDPVARIGEVEYTTIKAAFEAVESGQTIVILRDVETLNTGVIAEGKTVILDLNGKTLAHAEMATKYAINNLGTLTITGNGTVNSRGIYNGYGNGGENVATAKLTIENGSFNAKGTNGGAAVFNYGTANINGGSFTSIGGYSLNNQNGSSMTIADGVNANNGVYTSDATLTINGGEISGNRSGCHVIYCWNANITINGGTFYNNNSGNSTVMAAGTTTITYNGGTYGIKDGRVPGNGNTWTSCLLDSQNSAEVVVNDGTYNGGFRVQAGTSMTINGGSFNDCYGSAYNINGTATVKGGTYTDAAAIAFAKKYVAEGYEVIEDNGVCTVGLPEALVKFLADIAKGGEVTLDADITLLEPVVIESGKTVVLNLNGKTITAPDYAIENFGTLKINGNGTINGIVYCETGNTTVENGTFNATESGKYVFLNSQGGTLTINGGTINGGSSYPIYSYDENSSLVINNVTVNASFGCVNAYGTNSSVVINGGTYKMTGVQGKTSHIAYFSNVDAIINGGTFQKTGDINMSAAGGGGICAIYGANLTIKGGNFEGDYADVYNWSGTNANGRAVAISIKGGSYKFKPSFVAEGYKAIEENGKYVVVTE